MSDPVEQRLRTLLRDDPVPEVRAEAARALSAIGEPDAVIEPLVAALADANTDVRRVTTLALGRIRDPRAVDALLKVLEERPELWRECSAAIGSAGDRDLIDRLLPLLDAESNHVRSGAIRAIAAVSSPTPASGGQPLFEYTDDEGHRHPLF